MDARKNTDSDWGLNFATTSAEETDTGVKCWNAARARRSVPCEDLKRHIPDGANASGNDEGRRAQRRPRGAAHFRYSNVVGGSSNHRAQHLTRDSTREVGELGAAEQGYSSANYSNPEKPAGYTSEGQPAEPTREMGELQCCRLWDATREYSRPAHADHAAQRKRRRAEAPKTRDDEEQRSDLSQAQKGPAEMPRVGARSLASRGGAEFWTCDEESDSHNNNHSSTDLGGSLSLSEGEHSRRHGERGRVGPSEERRQVRPRNALLNRDEDGGRNGFHVLPMAAPAARRLGTTGGEWAMDGSLESTVLSSVHK